MTVPERHGSWPAKLVTVLVCLVGWLGFPAVSQATTRTFVGPGSDWFTASNWSPSGVPSSSDDVIVDSGSVTITGAAASARSLAFDTGVSQSATLTIDSGASLTTSSSGTSAIGGFLTVNGTLTLGDPTTFASSANSNGINVSGTVAVDSTLTLDGSDAVHGNINATAPAALIDVVSGGSLVRDTSSATQTVAPKVDDDGSISVKTGTLSLAGGDAGSSSGSVAVSSGATLLVGGSTFESPSVSGAGTLDLSGVTATVGSGDTFTVAKVHFSNNATLTVNKDLSVANLASDGGIRNGTGTLTITGTADLSDMTLASGAATTVANTVTSVALTRYLAVDGTLNLDTPTTFGGSADSNGLNVSGTLNVGSTLTLDGSDSVHGNINPTGPNALIHVLSAGSLVRDTSTDTQTLGPAVENDGSVSVQTGTLALPGGLTQTSGTTEVGASTQLTGPMTIDGGTLDGTGDLGGPVDNVGGTVAPGTSPGILTIDGDYTQAGGGTLKADIAGTTVGTGYDRLAVGGAATLDGTLAIVNDPSFDPALGDAFVVLTIGGARVGQFSALTGASVNGKAYAAQYDAHDVTLGVGLAAPANTAAPTIPSSAVTGTAISCDPGSWTGSPGFAFTWRSDGAPIAGATQQQYTLVDGDAGHTITCHVVATNGAGSTAADSNSLVPTLAPPANTAPPSIPAAGQVGDTITCDPGTWTHNPTFTFSWTRDGAQIGGATGKAYTLTAADAGHAIRCLVTAHNSGGDGGPVASGPLAAGTPPAAVPTPVAITQIATLPSPHVCISRRRFRIHLKGISGIVQARIQLTGVPARTVRGKALGLPIDLRGLPKGNVVVKITITRKSGQRVVGKRTYHTCVSRRIVKRHKTNH